MYRWVLHVFYMSFVVLFILVVHEFTKTYQLTYYYDDQLYDVYEADHETFVNNYFSYYALFKKLDVVTYDTNPVTTIKSTESDHIQYELNFYQFKYILSGKVTYAILPIFENFEHLDDGIIDASISFDETHEFIFFKFQTNQQSYYLFEHIDAINTGLAYQYYFEGSYFDALDHLTIYVTNENNNTTQLSHVSLDNYPLINRLDHVPVNSIGFANQIDSSILNPYGYLMVRAYIIYAVIVLILTWALYLRPYFKRKRKLKLINPTH